HCHLRSTILRLTGGGVKKELKSRFLAPAALRMTGSLARERNKWGARQARPMQERRDNQQQCCIVATGITGEFFSFKKAPLGAFPPTRSPEDSMSRAL